MNIFAHQDEVHSSLFSSLLHALSSPLIAFLVIATIAGCIIVMSLKILDKKVVVQEEEIEDVNETSNGL